ncbi:MAG: PD-(D/E)XK nuclease family protein [Myxococcaceae bacterium]|nr:PD-(D/E)XK nuclease family protein [Myxococcaceae bacterium]
MAPLTLRVFPDAGRVEHALLEASRREAFVDATGFWSLSQLVTACAPKTHRALSRLAARMLVARLVRELPAGPFGAWAKDVAFARGAVDLFAELEAQLATPDQLERAAADARSARAAWLARLWARFKAKKADARLADPADQLTAATAVLRRGVPDALKAFDRVELHGVLDLSPARLALLHALDAAFPGVALDLPRADNPAIDALVNEVHDALERRHESSRVDLKGDVPSSPFAALRLFTDDAAAQPFPSLSAFSAATPREEARELARRVRSSLDAGAAPEDVAVIFRDAGPDAALVVEALAEQGVPARARVGVPLRATPAGHLALGLPMLAEDAFPAGPVARLLSSRYLAKLWEPNVEPGLFFAAAALRDDRLGAEGGRGAYAVRLQALATRYAEGWPKGPSDEVRAVARQVDRLVAALAPLGAENTLAGHLRGWATALNGVGLFEGLRRIEPPGSLAGEHAVARDHAAADALTALQRLLAESAAVAGADDVRLSRRDFATWLNDAAAELELLVRGPRAGAVAVLDAREAHGRSFRHVFIGGLVDGRFPGRAGAGGLLAEDEKGALNGAARAPLFRLNVGESGERLPLRLAEDRLLFYLAACSATETLTLSHARGEALGRAFSPSPFLQEVARAAAGFEVKRVALGVVPEADAVSSEAELRLRALLDGAAPDAPWAADARALAAIEHERFTFFADENAAPGPHSGAVDPTLLGGAFAMSEERPLHPGALSALGNCAYAGFLRDVLGLSPLDAQGEDLDSRSKGTLTHRVLELLLPVIREALPENLEDVVTLAVDEAAGAHERRSPVGHPLLWKLARQRLVREVTALLRSQRVRPFDGDGFRPEKAELKFKVELPGVGWLGGKIDRVDVGPGGAAVVDYKNKKVEGRQEHVDRLLRVDWQLPVYAYAVRAAGLGDRVDAALVSTRQGQKKLSEIAADAGVKVDELLATDALTRARLEREGKPNLANAVAGLVGRLRRGDVSARPQDCQFCAYRAVCRISSRKLPEELGR